MNHTHLLVSEIKNSKIRGKENKVFKLMNISLKPEHENFITSQIEKGKYANADEVISAAFKLLEEREHKLEELRRKIAVGTEQIAKGKVTDGEVVFARLQEKIIRLISLNHE